MTTVPRYDREHLPSGQWAEYRKRGTTRMLKVTGPLIVVTKEGNECVLPHGWEGFVAIDSDGHPYPVDKTVHAQSYVAKDVQ